MPWGGGAAKALGAVSFSAGEFCPHQDVGTTRAGNPGLGGESGPGDESVPSLLKPAGLLRQPAQGHGTRLHPHTAEDHVCTAETVCVASGAVKPNAYTLALLEKGLQP